MAELSKHPFLLAKSVRIPSLKRRRKVWAFLPDDYFDNPEKRYPVIYFNDGQNVFEGWKAAFGVGWEIHESMRQLSKSMGLRECILIGIEHGNKHRITEYSPFNKDGSFAKEGDAYADFFANRLKKYVDKKLRTLKDRENTGIMGSSMGGLSALYTGFKHQDVYSVVGVFSASLWAAPYIYPLISRIGRHYHTRFFLSVGTREGKTTVKNMRNLHLTLKSVGFDSTLNIVKDGEHTEGLWQSEFRTFYKWIFGK